MQHARLKTLVHVGYLQPHRTWFSLLEEAGQSEAGAYVSLLGGRLRTRSVGPSNMRTQKLVLPHGLGPSNMLRPCHLGVPPAIRDAPPHVPRLAADPSRLQAESQQLDGDIRKTRQLKEVEDGGDGRTVGG